MKRSRIQESDLLEVLRDLNEKIVNKEVFCLTDIFKQHNIPGGYSVIFNERAILKEVERKSRKHSPGIGRRGKGKVFATYEWSNGMPKQMLDTLKLYATRIKQDYTEYRRRTQKKSVKALPTNAAKVLEFTSNKTNEIPASKHHNKFVELRETLDSGFVPITKSALLELKQIVGFDPFSVVINNINIFRINIVEIKETIQGLGVSLFEKVEEGDSLIEAARFILDDKKVYYFRKSKYQLELK